MVSLLFLVPAFPLFSSILLGIGGRSLSRKTVSILGSGSVGASAIVSSLLAFSFYQWQGRSNSLNQYDTQILWKWWQVGDFQALIQFHLDPLSLVMILMVSFVGFLIHLYSIEYMKEEEGYSRYFSTLNFFMASMLTLVLAGDLLLLFLGWEGIGLASYLLIGFWFKDSGNGDAARKAFTVTRVGDAFMMVGLLLLFSTFKTLNIHSLLERVNLQWNFGAWMPTLASGLLLCGALGKSAQIPLQTWLPNAMVGPTPVSALIHAATLVTAGVYLIARMQTLFALAPDVQILLSVIGTLTMLLGAIHALMAVDLKKILAYSTMSQVGYMFMALGAGASQAALFHLMTHAFFKADLFLAAGAIILFLHHEQNILRMGGLWKDIPWIFAAFLVGAFSLAGIPFLTAGFYSKEWILTNLAMNAPNFSLGREIWLAGMAGVFITSLYSFRIVFLVFLGEPRTSEQVPHYRKDKRGAKVGVLIGIPLFILSILSVIGGLLFRLTIGAKIGYHSVEEILIPSLLSLLGVGAAYSLTRPHRIKFKREEGGEISWGFDRLYERTLVRPFIDFSNYLRSDLVDLFFDGIAYLSESLSEGLSHTQNGKIRRYASAIVGGTVILLAMALWRGAAR